MSSNGNGLAKLDTTSLILSDNFDDMKNKAQMMIRSGLLPQQVKTPEQFIVIAFHALELGIPVMYAMRHIAVINGNPTADAQAMSGLIEKHFGDNAIIVTEQTPKQATVRIMKPGWKEPQFVTYTMEEAVAGKVNQSWDKEKKAWVEKHPWKSHPTDMLRSRAVSRAARTYFPASIGGLYTPEEMGAVVEVNDDGTMQIIDVNGQQQTVPHQAREVAPQRVQEPEPEQVEINAGMSRDEALNALSESGDSETLMSAWRDAEASGFREDMEFFGVALDLLKALLNDADTGPEWSRVMHAATASGFGKDPEIVDIARFRKQEIQAALDAKRTAEAQQETIEV